MKFKLIALLTILFFVTILVNAEKISISKVDVTYDKDKIKMEELSNGGKKFTIQNSGSLSASYSGNTIDYSGIESIEGKSPEITFNNEGKVIEAYFKTGRDGAYVLGNEEIYLPKGSEVKFKDRIAEIKYPSGTNTIKPPRAFDKNQGDSEFVFKNNEKKFLFENGNSFEGEVLKYKDGKYYFDSDAILDETLVKNPNKIKTYIDFEGKINGNYDSPYLSIDRKGGKIVIGSNVNIPGPAVSFKKENPFGIKIDTNEHFAVMCLGNSNGAYVSIQNRNSQGLVPRLETLNQFVLNQDTKSVYYNSDTGKLYLRAKEAIIKEFGSGTSTTPVEIHNFKNHDGVYASISKYNNVIGIGDEGEIGYGSNPTFITTAMSWGFKNNPAFKKGFSNNWFYYNIKTATDFEKFFGNKIDMVDQAGILKDPKNVRIMVDIVANVPKSQQNHIKRIELESSAWYMGLAESGGTMHLNVGGGIPIAVARHEMAHLHDFEMGNDFNRVWRSIGGNSGPHTDDYGYTSAEDTSTFNEYVYKSPDVWREYLSPNYKYHKKFIGRVAIFVKYGFFTQEEGARILSSVNLPSDPSSLNKYITEAQQSYSKIG